MAARRRKDAAWLLAVGRSIAKNLKSESRGTAIRIRVPKRTTTTNTDGWSVVIGDLGPSLPRLEIWLDRFSGHPGRKLFACARSSNRRQVTRIVSQTTKRLGLAREITNDDTSKEGYLRLDKPIARSEYRIPVVEKYADGLTFYGIYDPTQFYSISSFTDFGQRTIAFFQDIASCVPNAPDDGTHYDVYPRVENRKIVTSHLKRERSKFLAAEAKSRDKYRCRVCGLRFEDRYGQVGRGFAEAHHVVPLSHLKGTVKTEVDDLVTVCANCHRMLHRMSGKKGDVAALMRQLR